MPSRAPQARGLRTSRRRWLFATGALVISVAVVVGVVVATTAGRTASNVVTLTNSRCGRGVTAHAGQQTFTVVNTSNGGAQVALLNAWGGIVAEIAVIGPGTTVPVQADLGNGTYTFACYTDSGVTTSTAMRVTGAPADFVTSALQPVTFVQLFGPNQNYEDYAARQLVALAAAVTTMERELDADNLSGARGEWLTAMTDWERVGASYDSFGAEGEAIDGLPDGLPGGVNDPNFTGLHRLEYGLWHAQPATTLLRVARNLSTAVAVLRGNLDSTSLAGAPTNLPTRAHEILEDALRDHLSGIDDLGAGAAYPETAADLQVTRVVVGYLAPLLATRAPRLAPVAVAQMNALQDALDATAVDGQWRTPAQVSATARERVDAAVGTLLQTLAPLPDLLQIPNLAHAGDTS